MVIKGKIKELLVKQLKTAWEITRWANKRYAVLPRTNQHSPLDRLTPAQGRKKPE
jgi:hypothetical protein